MAADEFKRANGPYRHGNRWRVVLVRGDGRRVVKSIETRAAAQAAIDALRIKATGSRSLGSAVDAYLAGHRAHGFAAATTERIAYHLRNILGLPGNAERPLTWLRARGAELYEAARTGHAVDTHRNALNEAKRFGSWCVKQRWLRADPFADVEGIGRRQAGREKAQLRVDEARILTDYCIAQCTPVVQPEAVAVLAAWLMGTRASELVVRDVRDLDDDGRRFVIPSGKNRRAQRSHEVPDVLRPLLLALAAGRTGKEPLFLVQDRPTARRRRGPRRATRHWLYHWCEKICAAAGVPLVSPHGLRRSHISIAREMGATGAIVAAAVGHGSEQVQERSYVAPGSAERGRQRAVMQVLQGGKK